jgi:hypothetical protein
MADFPAFIKLSRENWNSFRNRITGRKCSSGYTLSQNLTPLARYSGKRWCIIMMQDSPYPCLCYTRHLTMMCALVLGLRCTASRTPPLLRLPYSRPAFASGKKSVAFKNLCSFSNIQQRGILCSWYGFRYFTTAASLFPLHKRTWNACFICKRVGYFVLHTALQHNTARHTQTHFASR